MKGVHLPWGGSLQGAGEDEVEGAAWRMTGSAAVRKSGRTGVKLRDLQASQSREKRMLMARSEVKCYCCGLTEECRPAYVATVKERHQDRWIYGFCVEAIKDENSRSSRKISTEEAMKQHVSFCEDFRMSSPPAKPTEYLIAAKQLLRRTKDSQMRERLGGCRPGMVTWGA
ncbi:hypothetical protein ACFX13_033570 [Malus domestica]